MTEVRRRGPGSKADDHHPTRHELLDAAIAVAERGGLGALSISDITGEAHLAKGTFYVHFGDRTELLVELHRQFHDELFQRIEADTAEMGPGRSRAEARVIAFLDGCRRMTGVRSMLLQARAEPAISAEVISRNDEAARLLAEDLRMDGRANPLETARLLVAATAETALLELGAKRTLHPLRRALLTLLGSP